MAQYFNVVANASGNFTLEEVPRICTADGQRIQLVVEDVNNNSNGSQRLVTYTAAPQNRKNLFIIKTNDIIGTQEILKPNTVNAHIVNENTVGIANNTSIKTECKNEGQQMQFMKIQNANTTIVSKQKTLLQEKNQTAILTKSNIQNNITSPSHLFINYPSFTPNQTEKKSPKSYQNKTRQLPNNIVGVVSQTPDRIKVVTTMENQIQNSNATGPKSTLPACKTINLRRQNVTVKPVRISNSNISHVRPAAIAPPEIFKIPARVQSLDIEHLNKQIKGAKSKRLQKRNIKKQKFQQNNTQRLCNTLQQVQPSPLNAPTHSFINSVQQRAQQISAQQMQKSVAMSVPASAEDNTCVANVDVEVNPSDCVQEKGQQPSSPRLEHENSSSENIAYLQKTINDPANAIVQHQIQGNSAKMLVMLAAGEQRLITFDIPNENYTVRDLLNQMCAVFGKMNTTFSGDTQVFLVDDPALDVNYIVDAGGSGLSSFQSDNGDCNSTPEHLNEQFKRAKFKRLQKEHIKKQRFKQNNTRVSNTLQQVKKSPLKASKHSFINSVQQRMQRISPQQMQKSMAMPVPASTEHNTRIANGDVKVNPSDCIQEKEQQPWWKEINFFPPWQQPSSPRLEHENSSSESMAYVQKTINDPANAIVQHQIQGNTAKMLVMLATGEQRLITFDIPNEDCTVRDLLDQMCAILGKVNIPFSSNMQVSLVDDPALDINYIVDAGGSGLPSFESDNGDSNSTPEHLNEQFKPAKFKRLQKQEIKKQRFKQNNTQRVSNTLQQVQKSPLNAPTHSFINSVQQRMQRISPQQMQKSVAMSVPASTEHNTRIANGDVKVNPSDCVQEKEQQPWWKEINFFPPWQQPSSPRLEHENSSNESIAYLQKTINDPANAIVQHQIQGNSAKMLVMLATGEQRLITFDIPNEDCTVRDLLDQMCAVLGKVNIPFSSNMQVSLVDDPALHINYIVDAECSGLPSFESDNGDSNSTPEHLNEQFKPAKFKRLQKQQIKKQRFKQNNTQRVSNTLQQVQKSPLNAPTHSFINSVQQRMQRISPQVQKSVAMSVPASTEHNTRVANGDVKVNPSDCVEEKEQQPSSRRLEHENSSSESMAYLQKIINDPANAIVQHQIQWNTAKILLILATGEERLITFDMPNKDCTVRDLLDQIRAVVGKMNITFSDDMQFSFINDALGINYIVHAKGSGLCSISFESDNGDCNSTYEIVNSTPNTENLSQNTNALDENSNNSLQTTEISL